MTAVWRPSLTRRVVLRHDPVRNADLLIAPERVVKLNRSAAAILRLLDGSRAVEDVVAALQEDCTEPVPEPDVREFLDRVRTLQWVR